MIKIGLTGSIASGKTTASKYLSSRNGPLFNADLVVKKLYQKNSFKKIVKDTLKIKANKNFKKELKAKILKNINNLKKLEKLIHPLVRKEMDSFIKKNKDKKFLFFEIPLLIESNLIKKFDSIIFISSPRSLRLKRYKSKGGTKHLFDVLDGHQINEVRKKNMCDHIVVNNKSLFVLKKKLFNIIKLYE